MLDVGCNWFLNDAYTKQENLNYAIDMIREAGTLASVSGLEISPKFQYYSTDEVIAMERKKRRSLYTQRTFELIRRAELTLDDLRWLKDACHTMGVQFSCTPFINPDKVKEIDPLVEWFKIRERDSDNRELVMKALRMAKPVYVSRREHDYELFFSHDNLKQVFCIPEYPATWDRIWEEGRFREMMYFDGYSNHVPDPAAPLLMASYALSGEPRTFYLEVHYKLRGTSPIDDAVSFTFDQVKPMVDVLRSWESQPGEYEGDDLPYITL